MSTSDNPQHLLREASNWAFSTNTLAWALQNCDLQDVTAYLHTFDKEEVRSNIESAFIVGEWPVVFFAIAKNNVKAVKDLLYYSAHGVGANRRSLNHHVPPLAFAILHSGEQTLNGTEVVKALLAHGADPSCVPTHMWEHPLTRPSGNAPKGFQYSKDSEWCRNEPRSLLAQSLNLSHRYYLWKASIQSHPAKHEQQAYEMHDLLGLFDLPYYIIGQLHASRLVGDRLFTQVAHKIRKPLVLMFAGSSGHGKTELAERLGEGLKAKSTIIDCTQISSSNSLLGSTLGYSGSDRGSQLNNFLSLHSGERSVVFLDEIEKMGNEGRQALLRITDSGTYHDRRNNSAVDTTRTIFIFATNSGSKTINRWYSDRLHGATDVEIAKVDIESLSSRLRKEFVGVFGAPLTGRCSLIVPFFPFSQLERAVVVHSFILKAFEDLRGRVDRNQRHLIGHIHLDLQEDEHVATAIADSRYDWDLGARMLDDGVTTQIIQKVDAIWKSYDIDIDEKVNKGPLRRYVVQVSPGGEDGVINVFEKGVKEAPID